MLIEYTVKNFRSFRDEVVLSMVADKNRELADTNTFQVGDTNLLKVACSVRKQRKREIEFDRVV